MLKHGVASCSGALEWSGFWSDVLEHDRVCLGNRSNEVRMRTLIDPKDGWNENQMG